jgi:hypothetical protein
LRLFLSATALLVVALTVAACDRSASPEFPPGRVVVGDAGLVAGWLEELEVMTGTPLSRSAALARERLSSCEQFEAWCGEEGSCALLEQLSCRPESSQLEAMHQLRGESDFLFAVSLATGQRLTGRGSTVEDGRREVELELSRLPDESALTLLLPSSDGPGRSVLSSDQALTHIRIRPDGGLNLASVVSQEGWANRLFQLRSDLFLATALKGNWELAVYVPEEHHRMPPMALALDFNHRGAAVSAMEQFLDQVMQAWPVRKSPFSARDFPGACLSNLKVMPDLEPCYVATDEALVVGWNPSSIERAVAPVGPELELEESRVVLYLDRFPLADERLAVASGAGQEAGSTAYPWAQIRVTGSRSGKSYVFRLTLLPRESL